MAMQTNVFILQFFKSQTSSDGDTCWWLLLRVVVLLLMWVYTDENSFNGFNPFRLSVNRNILHKHLYEKNTVFVM